MVQSRGLASQEDWGKIFQADPERELMGVQANFLQKSRKP